MKESYYDLQGQPQRLERVSRLLVQFTLDHFTETGNWEGETPPPALRERLWYAMAYMASGHPQAGELASRIIASSTYAMCHFA